MATLQVPLSFYSDIGGDIKSSLVRREFDAEKALQAVGLLGLIDGLKLEIKEGKLTNEEAGAVLRELHHLC